MTCTSIYLWNANGEETSAHAAATRQSIHQKFLLLWRIEYGQNIEKYFITGHTYTHTHTHKHGVTFGNLNKV